MAKAPAGLGRVFQNPSHLAALVFLLDAAHVQLRALTALHFSLLFATMFIGLSKLFSCVKLLSRRDFNKWNTSSM